MKRAGPMAWTDEARRVPFLAVAEALGLRAGRRRGTCPACGQTRISAHDRRGPLRLGSDAGWLACCGEGRRLDGLALVALVTCGSVRPPDWAPVRQWYADHGWAQPAEERADWKAEPVPPAPDLDPADFRHADAADLWRRTVPLSARADAVAFLRGRLARVQGLDVSAALAEVEAQHLARALPVGADCPWWAKLTDPDTRVTRSWSGTWPLIIPTWDHAGRLASLRARRTIPAHEDDPMGHLKEISAKAVHRDDLFCGADTGSVYACAIGRRILRAGGAAPGDILPGAPAPWSGRALFLEGGPAWIATVATISRVQGARPAIFGLWSGAVPGDRFGVRLFQSLSKCDLAVIAEDPGDGGRRIADRAEMALRGVAVKVQRFTVEEI